MHSRMSVFLLSAITSCQECPLLSTGLPSTAHCCVWRTESTRSGTAMGLSFTCVPDVGFSAVPWVGAASGVCWEGGMSMCPRCPLSHSWCPGCSEPCYSWAWPEHVWELSCNQNRAQWGFPRACAMVVGCRDELSCASSTLAHWHQSHSFSGAEQPAQQDVNLWFSVCFF